MNITQYRPDIDGLRSIAILSVLLHHLNAELLPGGFIGVDIFFVISGYLITTQIYKEILNRSFSIKQFYKRRINRIVPALATVTVVTLCVGFVLLSPADLELLTKSAIFSITGLSNLFFWREYGNYFASNSAEAPLLHTWSLGVEEQFYLFWPLLLVLLVKVSGRYVLGFLAIFLLGSFFISEAGTRIAMSASYYILPTRFFELLIGSFLALLNTRYQPKNTRQSSISFLAGMTLIAGSLIWIDKASSFPGVNALWPCLGSALLIWSGQYHCLLHRSLTNRPMVFVGLISYSLYLWHWPLIAFFNYLDIDVDLVSGTSIFAIALLLAWLSWKFVETPMRQRGANLPIYKVFIQRLAIPATAFMLMNLAVTYSNGFPQRFDPQVALLEAALAAKPNVLRNGCHVPTAMYDMPPNKKCTIGASKQQLDGILIGDSFANHFTGMIDVLALNSEISLMDYTMDGCPPIIGFNTGKVAAYAERCIKRNKMAYAKIASEHYSQVVLAGNWPTNEDLTNPLSHSIDAILATGAKLTIVLSNASIPNASSCSIRKIMYGTQKQCEGLKKAEPYYFENIRSKYPMIQFLDPNTVICQDERCRPVVDNVLLYRDDAHLNDIGSRLVGRNLLMMGVEL